MDKRGVSRYQRTGIFAEAVLGGEEVALFVACEVGAAGGQAAEGCVIAVRLVVESLCVLAVVHGLEDLGPNLVRVCVREVRV